MSVYFSLDVLNKLAEEAARKGIAIPTFIREIVIQHLREEGIIE